MRYFALENALGARNDWICAVLLDQRVAEVARRSSNERRRHAVYWLIWLVIMLAIPLVAGVVVWMGRPSVVATTPDATRGEE